jgi:hypothetical protein
MEIIKKVVKENDELVAYIVPYEEKFKLATNSGWGCGYVKIKPTHTCYKDILIEQIRENAHYIMYSINFSDQITYTNFNEDGSCTIGFDTAHGYNSNKDTEQDLIKTTLELFDAVDSINNAQIEFKKKLAIENFANRINSI